MINPQLNMVGLLQSMWLLGEGSPVQDQIADVQQPSTDNLKHAGLVIMQLGNMSHQDMGILQIRGERQVDVALGQTHSSTRH
ncbi:uncharacterized protein C8R40DRAFT_889198 [Lentinula edodes]|uniref:uncharacterized protein n=1 Tax=Lentinula edodes TaxID=5353 RepID=UPI001E8E105E|nr:uncharacterized protein C8R40DRAFT_889198 [Lentinula edodes]KAH7867920.1 hypothetical protein C8R40DRAFT_889198 [Lentinula edodes]